MVTTKNSYKFCIPGYVFSSTNVIKINKNIFGGLYGDYKLSQEVFDLDDNFKKA